MATHSSILAWRIRMDRGLHVAPHGLAGYSPWGHKQSDMTEQLSTAVQFCISFVKFILKNFFDDIVNEIVLLILFSEHSLVEYKNIIEICVLILYSSTLPISLLILIVYIYVFLMTFYLQNYVIWKQRSFYFYFCNLPFIYFSCIISLAETAIAMLNRSAESKHPCHDPNFRGTCAVIHSQIC